VRIVARTGDTGSGVGVGIGVGIGVGVGVGVGWHEAVSVTAGMVGACRNR
jgi:hypothetical protein